MILPFFEKEPDWSKFHSYEWPDGRTVYEINLANKEMVLSSEFKENMPQADPRETVIQNIMFVENRENGRFDPVIARYYPADEYSISAFDEISYNKIGAGWSGKVDIWTYDERYFIGFVIEDGVIVSTAHPQWYMNDQNARKLPNTGEITLTTCILRETVIETTVSTSTGSTTTYHVESSIWYCPSGGGGDSIGSPYTVGGGSTYEWPSESWSGSAGGGGGGTSATSGQTYTPPAITVPKVINQLTNPCASELFKGIKKGGLISAVSSSGAEFSKNIIDLLNASDKYNVIIRNSNFEGNGRTKTRSFNETTGKYDIMIELSNEYLSKATQLSIVRTIIHESIHAYLLHENYTNPTGDLFQNLNRYAIGRNYSGHKFHHEFMPQFIDAIAYSLWSWDMANGSKGQIPISYMKDLAWGGLTSYKDKNGVIKYYDSFKERFPNSNDRNRIERNIKNESDGNHAAKSQKCT